MEKVTCVTTGSPGGWVCRGSSSGLCSAAVGGVIPDKPVAAVSSNSRLLLPRHADQQQLYIAKVMTRKLIWALMALHGRRSIRLLKIAQDTPHSLAHEHTDRLVNVYSSHNPDILTWLHVSKQPVHITAAVIGPLRVVFRVIKLTSIQEKASRYCLQHLRQAIWNDMSQLPLVLQHCYSSLMIWHLQQ
jgi:hypothetical protein